MKNSKTFPFARTLGGSLLVGLPISILVAGCSGGGSGSGLGGNTNPTATPISTTSPTPSGTTTPTSPTPGGTASPTSSPTAGPTTRPTTAPTTGPTTSPTLAPTTRPTTRPTTAPTSAPIPAGVTLTFSNSSGSNALAPAQAIPIRSRGLDRQENVLELTFEDDETRPSPRRIFDIEIANQGPIVAGRTYQVTRAGDEDTGVAYVEHGTGLASKEWVATSGTLRVISITPVPGSSESTIQISLSNVRMQALEGTASTGAFTVNAVGSVTFVIR